MTAALEPPVHRPRVVLHEVGGHRPAASPLGAARMAAGLTITDLARALHMSRPAVAMWESGSRGVSAHYWAALGDVLGLEFEQVAALFRAGPRARLDGIRLPGLARERRAITVTGRSLAAQVGVAPSTLSMWETAGVPVPRATAERLAELLGCSVLSLTREADRPDERPLRRMRRDARMTCREAAGLLAISVATLARYEAGDRDTPVPVLRRMALIYRRPSTDLLALRRRPLPPLPPRPWHDDNLADVLAAMRQYAGLTKVDLGRLVNRSGQAVRGWETGRTRPPVGIRRRLEMVLQLPAGSLGQTPPRIDEVKHDRSVHPG